MTSQWLTAIVCQMGGLSHRWTIPSVHIHYKGHMLSNNMLWFHGIWLFYDAHKVSQWQYCRISVIMTLWPTCISIHDVTNKYPKPTDPWRLLICNLFSWNTSHSQNNLRRVSKSSLLHPFTHRRSGTLDWCVTRATSADSSRLIHTILAHSSTLCYFSIFSRLP
jgi:hypothetical protein